MLVAQEIGAVCYASDYPHRDSDWPNTVRTLVERDDVDDTLQDEDYVRQRSVLLRLERARRSQPPPEHASSFTSPPVTALQKSRSKCPIDMHNHRPSRPEVIPCFLELEGPRFETRIIEENGRRFFLIKEMVRRPIVLTTSTLHD